MNRFYGALIFCFINLGANLAAQTSDASLIDILQAIQLQNNSQNLDELIDTLPESVFRYPYFLYASRGLMQASLISPRILLVYPERPDFKAYTILTFNGERTQTKNDTLELLRFESDSKKDSAGFSLFTYQIQNGRSVVQKNPMECQKCHGAENRPLWTSYDLWPGVYGNFVLKSDSNDSVNFGPTQLHPLEAKAVEEFNSSKSHRPRYRRISTLYRIFDTPFELIQDDLFWRTPNLRLDDILEGSNELKIFNDLKSKFLDSNLRKWRWVLYLLSDYQRFSRCIDTRNLLPKEISHQLIVSYEDLKDESARLFTKEMYQDRVERMSALFPTEPGFFSRPPVMAEGVALMRFVFENNGIDMSQWSLNFPRSNYIFRHGATRFEYGSFYHFAYLYKNLFENQLANPEDQKTLRALKKLEHDLNNRSVCSLVFDASQRAFIKAD